MSLKRLAVELNQVMWSEGRPDTPHPAAFSQLLCRMPLTRKSLWSLIRSTTILRQWKGPKDIIFVVLWNFINGILRHVMQVYSDQDSMNKCWDDRVKNGTEEVAQCCNLHLNYSLFFDWISWSLLLGANGCAGRRHTLCAPKLKEIQSLFNGSIHYFYIFMIIS
jgi:hypothetical protein